METNIIVWWVVLSAAVGGVAYYFFKWLLSGDEPEQTEEEKQKDLEDSLAQVTNDNASQDIHNGYEDNYHNRTSQEELPI